MVRISSLLAASASLALSFAAPAPAAVSANPNSDNGGDALTTRLSVAVEPPTVQSPSLLLHLLSTTSLLPHHSDPSDHGVATDHPLLTSKTSHLVLRVEVSNGGVSLNGVEVPLLPSPTDSDGHAEETAEVFLELPHVQTLRLPADSKHFEVLEAAVDGEGRLSPEALEKLDEEVFGDEGVVGVKVGVARESVKVEIVGAFEEGDEPLMEPEGWEVMVAVEVLTLHGHALRPFRLPPLKLLHIALPSTSPSSPPFTRTTLLPPIMPPKHAPSSLIPGAGRWGAIDGAAPEPGREGEKVRGTVGKGGKKMKGKGRKGSRGRKGGKQQKHKQADADARPEGREEEWFGRPADQNGMNSLADVFANDGNPDPFGFDMTDGETQDRFKADSDDARRPGPPPARPPFPGFPFGGRPEEYDNEFDVLFPPPPPPYSPFDAPPPIDGPHGPGLIPGLPGFLGKFFRGPRPSPPAHRHPRGPRRAPQAHRHHGGRFHGDHAGGAPCWTVHLVHLVGFLLHVAILAAMVWAGVKAWKKWRAPRHSAKAPAEEERKGGQKAQYVAVRVEDLEVLPRYETSEVMEAEGV